MRGLQKQWLNNGELDIDMTVIPEKTWHQRAREEGIAEKLNFIRKYAADKRKIVIVARYLSQIDYLAKELVKEREVFVLTGSTKDQEQIISDARESFECYFICQAGLGSGFELPEFDFMVFVSLSFSVRDLVQMKGRVNRINRLKSNWYTYLIGGPLDEKVYQRVCVDLQDFVI